MTETSRFHNNPSLPRPYCSRLPPSPPSVLSFITDILQEDRGKLPRVIIRCPSAQTRCLPATREALKGTVVGCLELSPAGNCRAVGYVPISDWDVSRVTGMEEMFYSAKSFQGDISNWDVSRVTDMGYMFWYAESFNGDISKWNVSHVTTMNTMFRSAKKFNMDLSKWDVSRVIDMQQMFFHADAFDQTLCGKAWVNSAAAKVDMFNGSKGRISPVCGLFLIEFIFYLTFLFFTQQLRAPHTPLNRTSALQPHHY